MPQFCCWFCAICRAHFVKLVRMFSWFEYIWKYFWTVIHFSATRDVLYLHQNAILQHQSQIGNNVMVKYCKAGCYLSLHWAHILNFSPTTPHCFGRTDVTATVWPWCEEERRLRGRGGRKHNVGIRTHSEGKEERKEKCWLKRRRKSIKRAPSDWQLAKVFSAKVSRTARLLSLVLPSPFCSPLPLPLFHPSLASSPIITLSPPS